MIFTNYLIVFLHYRETNYTGGFMAIISIILFIIYLVVSNAGGDWTKWELTNFLFRSPLTILCIIVGTVFNFLPIYIGRRFE